MKVWRVLGARGGALPPQVVFLAGGAFAATALLWRGKGRFFAMLIALLAAYGFGWLLRRLFDGRDEILFLMWRVLTGGRGSYILLEKDRR